LNTIDCNYCKEYVKRKKQEIIKTIQEQNLSPTLCIIQVGDNFASNKYIAGKIKDCEEVGIKPILFKLKENTSEEALIKVIKNANKKCDGIIVQLPLPKHISIDKIQNAIDDDKDVDGFKTTSKFVPCTPLGVYRLLNEITPWTGKHVVVIGRSKIVGNPMINLLLEKTNATITCCNSHTKNLKDHVGRADIIISAAGKQKLITKDMVKEGAIIVDVGINMNENGKMCGDVDYDNVKDLCSFVTPVPGGIGLITRVTLLENVILATRN
jgi:methylenetetrahydrofolate dehydrogenase (NADP+)/methenyltetrahydrofolate cyclohydrolase